MALSVIQPDRPGQVHQFGRAPSTVLRPLPKRSHGEDSGWRIVTCAHPVSNSREKERSMLTWLQLNHNRNAMDSITNCIAELRSKRQQLDEAIVALERFTTGAGKRRGRPPQWLRVAEGQDVHFPAMKRKEGEGKISKPKKRKMSTAGKLAIQIGVVLRQWKAANPSATEEDVAKQRDRIRQQLQYKVS